jgi:hypothetical protein
MRQSHSATYMRASNPIFSSQFGGNDFHVAPFRKIRFAALTFALAAGTILTGCKTSHTKHAAGPKKVLVVTVTKGFRHSSIPTAEKVLGQLAEKTGLCLLKR